MVFFPPSNQTKVNLSLMTSGIEPKQHLNFKLGTYLLTQIEKLLITKKTWVINMKKDDIALKGYLCHIKSGV